MKKLLLSLTIITFSLHASHAQDTLFYENFQTGGSSFVLNTTDVSSTATGYNSWILNNSYNGGSGSVVCLGIPLNFNVPNTSAQPGGIFGSPNGIYMHILSDAAVNSGINNCCFLAADGLCNNAQRYFTKMNTDINTTGYDTVSISFWWLCAGGNNSYGEVYYSTDGGTSWNLISTPMQKYNSHASWTLQSITLPAFAGQNTIRFGFRFVNQVAAAASDPGFALDDIRIIGTVSSTTPVISFSASDTAFCEESCIDFFDLSTNSPTSWQWYFPGASPPNSNDQNPVQVCYSAPGLYDVTLVATNASGQDSLTLPGFIEIYAAPPTPTVTPSINNDTLCSSPAFAYQWYLDGAIIPGADGQCYVPTQAGSYFVTITDATGCSASSSPVIISGIVLLSAGNEDFTILPNPSHGVFSISYSKSFSKDSEILITDVTGRAILSKQLFSIVNRIDLSNEADGIYFIRLDLKDRIINKKLMLIK